MHIHLDNTYYVGKWKACTPFVGRVKEEDMFEFGSGFEIFIENSAVLEVKLINVHSKEVIPT